MSKLKTIKIHGKEYVQVNDRIMYFRSTDQYKEWSMTTDIVHYGEGRILCKAVIADENGVVKATGIAEEKEGSSNINRTSYVENCETSAWGRALGNLGIGVDSSVATYEEVKTAMIQQEEMKPVEKVETSEEEYAALELMNVCKKKYRELSILLGGEKPDYGKANKALGLTKENAEIKFKMTNESAIELFTQEIEEQIAKNRSRRSGGLK